VVSGRPASGHGTTSSKENIVTTARILIVEDEADFSRTLEKHLRRLNYEVLGVATSGNEALRLVEAGRPDLVLSDISILGGLDGFELAEQIWKRFQLPVVFLTGHADPETIERVRQSQAFGYLSKPFRAGELKAAIEQALVRHGTEKRLEAAEESLLAAIRCAADAVVTTDPAALIQFLNPSAELLLGVASGRAVGRPLPEVLRFPQRQPAIEDMLRVGGTGNFIYETSILTATGREIVVELTVSTIRDEVRGRLGSVVILRDIRERKRFEAELGKSRSDYQALAGYLESVREAERTRIAREIHDELGQLLTGFKYDLAWLEKRLQEKPEFHGKVQEMTAHLHTMMGTVRRISAELRPGVLDELGLAAAVEWQVRDFERRTGVVGRMELTLRERPLVREAATALFRVLQEGLTNVARHARARRVQVVLGEQDEQLVLEIRDDGCGVSDAELNRPDSFGLMGMRERIQALRGSCEIQGTPGGGTMVRVRVPLAAVLMPETKA